MNQEEQTLQQLLLMVMVAVVLPVSSLACTAMAA
jgi:hypothetical protein